MLYMNTIIAVKINACSQNYHKVAEMNDRRKFTRNNINATFSRTGAKTTAFVKTFFFRLVFPF